MGTMKKVLINFVCVKVVIKLLDMNMLNNSNLMPAVIEAVKAYATVGEIIQVMKDVYGEYEEPIFF